MAAGGYLGNRRGRSSNRAGYWALMHLEGKEKKDETIFKCMYIEIYSERGAFSAIKSNADDSRTTKIEKNSN